MLLGLELGSAAALRGLQLRRVHAGALGAVFDKASGGLPGAAQGAEARRHGARSLQPPVLHREGGEALGGGAGRRRGPRACGVQVFPALGGLGRVANGGCEPEAWGPGVAGDGGEEVSNFELS